MWIINMLFAMFVKQSVRFIAVARIFTIKTITPHMRESPGQPIIATSRATSVMLAQLGEEFFYR